MKRVGTLRSSAALLALSGALALGASPSATAAGQASSSALAHLAEAAPSSPCVVPEVFSVELASAEEMVVAAGCTVGSVTYVGSRSVREGSVVSAQAAVGTSLPHGYQLALAVSAGPPCTVPRIGTARTLARITARLKAANCTVGKIHRVHSARRRGAVIKLSATPGRLLPPKAAVQVYLSSGRG